MVFALCPYPVALELIGTGSVGVETANLLSGMEMSMFTKFFKSWGLGVLGLVLASALFAEGIVPGTSTTLLSEMELEVKQFKKVSAAMNITEDCVPARVGGFGRIDIQYLDCAPEALERDGLAFKITDQLVVPKGIARRVNFWRRVYSLWSKNQYVLHVGDIPEIVLEIHDSSRLRDMGDKAREKIMKPWLDVRRRQYQQILIKLHNMKNLDPERLSEVERRLVQLFEHVDRKDKYFIAAQSLRVQRGQREYIEKGLESAPRYLPYIEQEFARQGVMPELARIAFIESSFNLQAYSKVGASGVYQLMPDTGKEYLIVDGGIDERNDPIKASRAAAKLFLMNYRILGEWPLAITAYNHGVGGIRRAMQSVGSSNIVDLINRYDGPNFGFASKNFYSGFLGLLITLQNSQKLFPAVKRVEPLHFALVHAGGMSVTEVKSKYHVTSVTMSYMNNDIGRGFLRDDNYFPRGYMLKVPEQRPQKPEIVRLASGRRH